MVGSEDGKVFLNKLFFLFQRRAIQTCLDRTGCLHRGSFLNISHAQKGTCCNCYGVMIGNFFLQYSTR